MADFNIDEILSGYEGKTSKAKSSGALDIDSLLSGFKSSEPVAAVTKTERPRVVIDTTPRPPISGISKEAEAELNTTRESKGLPTEPILTSKSAYEHHVAGKEMFSSGIEDLGTGHPYKGLGKAALGAVMVAGAPLSGIIDDTIGQYGNKIGPGFGDRAAIIANTAVPVVPGAGQISKVAAHVPIVKSLSNYTKNKSFKDLVEAIGPENIPMVVKEMKANPRLGPADLSPRVLQDAQHLFVNDGQHINYLKNTSDARMATRKNTIEAAYDASAGVSPDLAQKMTDLANAARKVGDDKIQPALKAAKPVDLSGTLSSLDGVLKPGALKIGDAEPLIDIKRQLESISKRLRSSKEYDANDLHKFQSKLRERADDLESSAAGSDRAMGKALRDIRNNIVSDIDKAAPGYKDALSAYRDEKNIAEAFREGHDKILTSSKKIENDPSFVKKWFDGLSEHEQQAVKEGVRTAIHTEIGVAKNPALAGESVMRSDFNKAKMETILGKEEAQTLFKALEDERKIANTHNKIIENSQTAMRTASKDKWAMPTPTEAGKQLLPLAVMEGSNMLAGGVGGVGTALYTGARIANSVKDAAKLKIFRENQAQYAKNALPVEGPSRDELIRNLEAMIPKPKLSMLNKVRASLPASQP